MFGKSNFASSSEKENNDDRKMKIGISRNDKSDGVEDLREEIIRLLEQYITLSSGLPKDGTSNSHLRKRTKTIVNNIFNYLDGTISKRSTNEMVDESAPLLIEVPEKLEKQDSSTLSESPEKENLLSISQDLVAGRRSEIIAPILKRTKQQIENKSTSEIYENALLKDDGDMSLEIMRKLDYINVSLDNIRVILLRKDKY